MRATLQMYHFTAYRCWLTSCMESKCWTPSTMILKMQFLFCTWRFCHRHAGVLQCEHCWAQTAAVPSCNTQSPLLPEETDEAPQSTHTERFIITHVNYCALKWELKCRLCMIILNLHSSRDTENTSRVHQLYSGQT